MNLTHGFFRNCISKTDLRQLMTRWENSDIDGKEWIIYNDWETIVKSLDSGIHYAINDPPPPGVKKTSKRTEPRGTKRKAIEINSENEDRSETEELSYSEVEPESEDESETPQRKNSFRAFQAYADTDSSQRKLCCMHFLWEGRWGERPNYCSRHS